VRLLNRRWRRSSSDEFFRRVLSQAKPHLSDEHFTVDGTLIEAWASQKSFQKKDGGDDNPGQFRGDKRRNETHESKTDPEARLYRKGNGQEAKLGYLGHVLMESSRTRESFTTRLRIHRFAMNTDSLRETKGCFSSLLSFWE